MFLSTRELEGDEVTTRRVERNLRHSIICTLRFLKEHILELG